MRKSIEYFYNRILYEIVVFFQMRWIITPLLTFANKIRKRRSKQTKNEKYIDVSSFFSPNDYILTLRGWDLFVGIGTFPIGLYLTRNIHSVVASVLIIIIVSLLPVFIFDYLFLMKKNKFAKYYKQFERDSQRVKTKWVIISILFIATIIVLFVLNWIMWERYKTS